MPVFMPSPPVGGKRCALYPPLAFAGAVLAAPPSAVPPEPPHAASPGMSIAAAALAMIQAGRIRAS